MRYGHPGYAAQSRPSIVGSIPQSANGADRAVVDLGFAVSAFEHGLAGQGSIGVVQDGRSREAPPYPDDLATSSAYALHLSHGLLVLVHRTHVLVRRQQRVALCHQAFRPLDLQ